MIVSAVVVSHGHAVELERLLPALAPQVDEIVVVANVPRSVGALPPRTRVIENEAQQTLARVRTLGPAAVNAGATVPVTVGGRGDVRVSHTPRPKVPAARIFVVGFNSRSATWTFGRLVPPTRVQSVPETSERKTPVSSPT